VDRPADILDRGVAQDLDVPGFAVDFDVADMRRKAGPGPCALTWISALIGPPVRVDLAAIAANDSGSKLPAWRRPGRPGRPSIRPLGADVPDRRSALFSTSTTCSAARVTRCRRQR